MGEDFAVRQLKKRGYKILDRNYRTRIGEIDIVAKNGEYLCFVEVRLRKNCGYALPGETIDKRKQNKIRKCAQLYLLKHKTGDVPLRFDAVLIEGDVSRKERLKFEVLENAF